MSKTMEAFGVERKVTKIGNSLGVTMPEKVLNHLGIKQEIALHLVLKMGKSS